MTLFKRLAWLSLALAYAQVVLGAIVRVTGSGLGCGDEWPTCAGHLLPPFDQPAVVIEYCHRLTALLLFLSLLALIAAAARLPEKPGERRMLPLALGALGLYVALALMGAVVVWLRLPAASVVVHFLFAMLLLALLATMVMRAGGLGAARVPAGSVPPRVKRAAMGGAGAALLVVLLGGLTANVPGAAASCLGFPLCSETGMTGGGVQHIQLTHRVVAFLFFLHMIALAVSVRMRGSPVTVRRAVDVALGVVAAQIVVAATLVTHGLPPALQSLHQAVGTLVWVTTFTAAMLARRGAAPPLAGAGDAGMGPSLERAPRAMETPR
ncbi:MAG TPA: COX15/CtaA family protein [Gemmatimonadaceae bacterium]|nr:COX15/CtaA family protein [Gemmatimonadaceae bacterium]